MLEKIFGKKSTGVVYIVCASILLVLLAGFVSVYFSSPGRISNIQLLAYVLFTVLELALISAPVFVQKRFKLYIPPAVEIGICLYAALFCLGHTYYEARTQIIVDLTPVFGGFVVAMTVFCFLNSAAQTYAERKNRRAFPLAVAGGTFVVSAVFLALFNLLAYAFSAVFISNRITTAAMLPFSAAFLGGDWLFCLIGGITLQSHFGKRYRVRSFKNTDAAAASEDKTFRTVAGNVGNDDTDYKKLARSLKARYYAARIAYIALYGTYVLQTALSARGSAFEIALSASQVIGLAFTALLYVYEFRLYRRGERNQRLRRLKIAKAVARVYAIAFSLAAIFIADRASVDLTVVTSVAMAICNLCSLFYNLFGNPRRYPSAAERPEEAAEPPLPGAGSLLLSSGADAPDKAEKEGTEQPAPGPAEKGNAGQPAPGPAEGDAAARDASPPARQETAPGNAGSDHTDPGEDGSGSAAPGEGENAAPDGR